MPRRSSNADRIARAAAEAEAAAEEKKAAKKAKKPKKAAKKSAKKTAKKTAKKAAKKTAKKPAKRRARKPKAPQRMKLIWGVGKPGIAPVSHYAYKDLAAAQSDAQKRGEGFSVRKIRVPMEDEEDKASGEEE